LVYRGCWWPHSAIA